MRLDLIPSALVLGVTLAGLYGLLPVAIVLTYRVSRSIAFIHGGIAICGGLAYGVLSKGAENGHDFTSTPLAPAGVSMAVVIGLGALLGWLYGSVVMSRWLAAQPGANLTVMSIAALLLVMQISGLALRPGGASIAPSPFGAGSVRIADVVVTYHRIAILVILILLVASLAVFLGRTYTGLAIRAIADDVEASVWCGAKLTGIGAGVYALSGAIAALTGALFAASVAESTDGTLLLFARGLIIAVVGGLRSVSLALAGAVVFGVLETALVVDVFGPVSFSVQELILSGGMLAMVMWASRARREHFFLLGRPSP